MGTALATAIGVAEKRPEREVVAILGDGEALMGAGSFWSLAGVAPDNLLAVVLIDGHYTITGGQPLGVPDVFGEVAAVLGLRPPRRAPPTRSPRAYASSSARRCSRSATRTACGQGRRRWWTRRSCASASRKRQRATCAGEWSLSPPIR